MTSFADTVVRKVTHLTTREQVALLRVTGEHKDGFRDHVLIALALGTALREHEIVALNVGDVVTSRGNAKQRIELKVFKGRAGADTAQQEIMLSEVLRRKLERLVKLNRQKGHKQDPESPLFISRESMRLSLRQVRTLFVKWQKLAGFERSVHFHALRHTACTNVYANTKDIRLTQRFARHANVQTTMIYTHPSDEDMLRAVGTLRC